VSPTFRIQQTCQPFDVLPGDTVLHDDEVLFVDEVSRTRDGVVTLACFPGDRRTGRRQLVAHAAGATVTRLPGDSTDAVRTLFNLAGGASTSKGVSIPLGEWDLVIDVPVPALECGAPAYPPIAY
jgi:hypothetical protein